MCVYLFIVFPHYPFDVCRVYSDISFHSRYWKSVFSLFYFLLILLESCQFYWSCQRNRFFCYTDFFKAFLFEFPSFLFLPLLFPSFYMLWVCFAPVFLRSCGRSLDYLFQTFLLFKCMYYSQASFSCALCILISHIFTFIQFNVFFYFPWDLLFDLRVIQKCIT